MRISFALVLGLVASATAAPPSRTLERGIKHYDRRDYYSAHVELEKVTSGQSGDDAANVKRAELYVGKILYHLGVYAVSRTMFEKIRMEGVGSPYHAAALEWFVALAQVMPIELEVFADYPAISFDDRSLDKIRDELMYRRALGALHRGNLTEATRAAGRVSPQSAFFNRARLVLASAAAHATSTTAVALFEAVPDGDETGDIAALALAQLHARDKAWDKALAAYAKVRSTGSLGPRAAWEASFVRLEKEHRAPTGLADLVATPVLGPDMPEPAFLPAILAFDYCRKPAATTDALAPFRAASSNLTAELEKVLKEVAPAALYEIGTSKLSPRLAALVKVAMSGPSVARATAWVAELERELGLFPKMDKAYQATAAEGEVLQDVRISRSLAVAEAGRYLRGRLEKLAGDLAQLAKLGTIKVAAGGKDLVIPCP